MLITYRVHTRIVWTIARLKCCKGWDTEMLTAVRKRYDQCNCTVRTVYAIRSYSTRVEFYAYGVLVRAYNTGVAITVETHHWFCTRLLIRCIKQHAYVYVFRSCGCMAHRIIRIPFSDICRDTWQRICDACQRICDASASLRLPYSTLIATVGTTCAIPKM